MLIFLFQLTYLYIFLLRALDESDRLHNLEEEQEKLNSSLIALTSHFAQVQFRLKQIVDASSEEKEVNFQTFDLVSILNHVGAYDILTVDIFLSDRIPTSRGKTTNCQVT